jgi:hypothetical protein
MSSVSAEVRSATPGVAGGASAENLVRTSFLDPAFADVDLVVGEETFPAHRMVLAAVSPVFK